MTRTPFPSPLAGIELDVIERARAIRLLILDVDGVLTDGRLHFDSDGTEAKAFFAHDGHGIKMLIGSGVPVAIITSRSSPLVARRAGELGIEHLYQGQQDKRIAYAELRAQLKLDPAQVAYVGDDVIDLPVMCRCGLAVATADARPQVAHLAHWQAPNNGGHGAVRDTCELLLAAQGKLDALLETYLD